MMAEHMMKQVPHAMGAAGSMLPNPLVKTAALAVTGLAAGRSLLGGGFLRNPLMLMAAGVAAGYLMHKYEKEIVVGLAKASGMGKDFVLHQKENLADLMAEAQEKTSAPASAGTPAE